MCNQVHTLPSEGVDLKLEALQYIPITKLTPMHMRYLDVGKGGDQKFYSHGTVASDELDLVTRRD